MNELRIPIQGGTCVLCPIHERAIRVQIIPDGSTGDWQSPAIVTPATPAFTSETSAGNITLRTSGISATFDSKRETLCFRDAAGKLLLEEAPGTRRLDPGAIQGVPCHAVQQGFVSPPGEHLHGLGQFQDGHANLRGVTRRLLQVNTQIALPFILSNLGYGLFWHQPGMTDFNPADEVIALEKDPAEGPEFTMTVTGSVGAYTDTCRIRTYHGSVDVADGRDRVLFLDYGEMTNRHALYVDDVPVIYQENFWLPPSADARISLTPGKHTIRVVATKGEPALRARTVDDVTTFRSPHAHSLDYVVFSGSTTDEILAAYRDVTGHAPMLPLWAYGFWQCRERYTSQQDLLENARGYRERRLPVDVMVQDWQYWPKEQWAGMQFDAARYPDPAAMTAELRGMHMALIISVWENVSKDSDLGRAYEASDCYVPGSPWLDMTSPRVQAAHWEAMKTRLFDLGIDGWWLDATEPENDALAGTTTHLGPGELNRLTYPLYVSKAVYDGQRAAAPDRRVCILTRSAYPGQQRYASITWSGDIGWDWDAFRRQIVAGLNYCASGLPYWTTDIGGFFRPDDQYTDTAYHEILIRWFQFGTFNPIFRIHGFGSDTEIWRYGARFESAARRMLDLRYRLLPYLYATAWQTTSKGYTIMRPMLMDFAHDGNALSAKHQFLFGPSILVTPVTEPGISTQAVHLPSGSDWYDFWTGARHAGGQTLAADAPFDQIPLFVRAGAIIPLGPCSQYTGEHPEAPLEIRIYPGADGTFTLYDDSGDGFAYENGARATVELKWNDRTRTLDIGARQGNYPGMPAKRQLHLVVVSPGQGAGAVETEGTAIAYEGSPIQVSL